MRKLFKYICNNEIDVLYHNSSINFYRVYDNDIKKHLRDFFIEEKSSNEALEILTNILHDINNECNDNKTIKSKFILGNKDKKPPLEKLVLLVTNNCNFRCKYCYANGGNYGLPIENMTEQQAKNIIDNLVEKYDYIKNIQIFGGEPLLNYKAIKFICEYFKQLNLTKKISYMPNFGIVTNGTCFTTEIIELMKEFNFRITISLDGSSIIHDKLRPDVLGKGTFDKVLENFNNLVHSGVQRSVIGFECTYTQEHINNNLSIVDLLKFFKKEFNSLIVHITPVSIDKGNSLSIYKSRQIFSNYIKEAVCYTFDEIKNEKILNSIPIITGMLERIINRRQIPYICPSGMSSISVTNHGNITPCFVFTGKDASVGTLSSDINTIITNLNEFNNKHNTKDIDEKCAHCWAKSVCSGCLGALGEDLENKDRTYGFDVMCDTIQTILETTLIKLSELKSSEDSWNEFNEFILKHSNSI